MSINTAYNYLFEEEPSFGGKLFKFAQLMQNFYFFMIIFGKSMKALVRITNMFSRRVCRHIQPIVS